MNNAQAFLHLRIRQAEASVRAAQQQIFRSSTIAELVRAKTVSLPAELRAIKNNIPGYSALTHQSEDKARQIIKENVKQLARAYQDHGADVFRQQVARMQSGDWALLRGNFPRAWHEAQKEISRLEHLGREMREEAPAVRPKQ